MSRARDGDRAAYEVDLDIGDGVYLLPPDSGGPYL